MPTRQQIAQALSGFSAGFAGKLPELQEQLDEKRKQALVEDAFTIQQRLQTGDVSGAQTVLVNRLEAIEQLGGNPRDTDALLLKLSRGDIQGAFDDVSTVVDFGVASGRLRTPSGAQQFRNTVSAVQTDPKTGQQFVVITDPNTNETRRENVEGATQETPSQRTLREVGQVAGESRARARTTRTSAIKADLGDRNRQAARSQVPLREALRLAQSADQGLKGSAKTKLARLFPSIDVTKSAALDSNLQRLALDQLQGFKGPTTDFEFGVTQDIVGSAGDSKSANIARLNSLDRAMWFARREAQQFNSFAAQGNDPDTFVFDFDEEVKTKKGTFTLTDLQDTAVENNMTIEQVLRRLNK